MHRKTFLKLAFAAGAAPLMGNCSRRADSQYILWKRINLKVGLEKPVRIVHVSDTHLCYADGREDGRKRELSKQRERAFCGRNVGHSKSPLIRNLNEAIDCANRAGALVVHTGDLIDFASSLNFELGRAALGRCDNYIMAPGNHEFCQYIGDSPEDDAYKARSAAAVRKMAGNDISFCSRVFGGVNIVAIDNVYYYFDESAAANLEREVSKGLPIILAFHVPLYTKKFFDFGMVETGGASAAIAGIPDDMLKLFASERARRIIAPNKATKEFIKYAKSQPLIKAVLCGHYHCELEDRLWGDTMQYCVGATGRSLAAEIVAS